MPGADIILKGLESSNPLQMMFAGLFGIATIYAMLRALKDKKAEPASPASEPDDRRVSDELHRLTMRVDRVEGGQILLQRSLDGHHDSIERRLGDLQRTADRTETNSRATLELLTSGRAFEFGRDA